jgi:hypothetical protein
MVTTERDFVSSTGPAVAKALTCEHTCYQIEVGKEFWM